MKKEIYNELKQKLDILEKSVNGGKGSGNFGHSGRPGEVGGSGDGEGPIKEEKSQSKVKTAKPRKIISDKVFENLSENIKKYDAKRFEWSDYDTDGFADASVYYVKSDLRNKGMKKNEVMSFYRQTVKQGTELKDLSSEDAEKYLLGQILYAREHPSTSKVWASGGYTTRIDNRPTVDAVRALVDYYEGKKKKNSLSKEVEISVNGGKGSGNFGHVGRPGEVGGSASTGQGGSDVSESVKEYSRKNPEERASDELEMLKTIDRYGKNTKGTTAGYFFTKLSDKTGKMELNDEGLLTRKNKEITKDLVKTACVIQDLTKDIAKNTEITPEEKSALIDACCVLYGETGSALLTGGKWYADDSFTASRAWALTDGANSKSKSKEAKKFNKQIQTIKDNIYEMFKQKESATRVDAWDKVFENNFLTRKTYNEIKTKIEKLEVLVNGGKGSGNFGHAGRPGKKGGSAPEASSKITIPKTILDAYATSSSRFSDPDKMKVEITPKGNLHLMYDGKDVATIGGEKYSYDILEDLREQGVIEDKEEASQMEMDSIEKALLRLENEKKIDKIIGTEKIKQTDDKKTDDANYKKLQSDISKIKKVLSTEKSRENFGQEEVRKLKDKYADYMSGNWNVTERFRRAVDDFDDWASNYENNSLTRKSFNDIKSRVEYLEKLLNGGKGSGNFGHSGRRGEVGGSLPAGTASQSRLAKAKEEEEKAREEFGKYADEHRGLDYDQKVADRLGKKLEDATEDRWYAEQYKLYHPEWDEEKFTREQGPNGEYMVSEDGKIIKATPEDTLEYTAEYVGGINSQKRYEAIKETTADYPAKVRDAVMSYAEIEKAVGEGRYEDQQSMLVMDDRFKVAKENLRLYEKKVGKEEGQKVKALSKNLDKSRINTLKKTGWGIATLLESELGKRYPGNTFSVIQHPKEWKQFEKSLIHDKIFTRKELDDFYDSPTYGKWADQLADY